MNRTWLLLPVVLAGCGVLRSLAGRNTVDLEGADVRAMSVDIRKQDKTICPRERVQMAIFADVVLAGDKQPKKLETWYGPGSRNGKMDFDAFAFHSEQGQFDAEGWFTPNSDVLATAGREFQLTTVYRRRPDKFSFDTSYKPDYRCIDHAGSAGASGNPGSAGADGTPGQEGRGGSTDSPGTEGGDGRSGGSGGDGGDGIGLEKIRCHTGTVTDVVTDVVGDNSWVARVVFGDSGFDFTDKVGSDVGGFGEDTTTESGENRDERGTKSKTDQSVNIFGGQIKDSDPEQAETDDQQAGYRAAFESDIESFAQSAFGGFGGSNVSSYRDKHAYETGQSAETGTNHETNRGFDVEGKSNNCGKHHTDDQNRHVLPAHVCAGAFLYGSGDFLHSLVAVG